MTTRASGTFEVKLTPQAPDDKNDDASPGRMSIDKQFHGDLEATSKGQMLAAMTVQSHASQETQIQGLKRCSSRSSQ